MGTEYIKFGIANSPRTRLNMLQTGCPYELSLAASADWPNIEEGRIHRYLSNRGRHLRGEWFVRSSDTEDIINIMRHESDSLKAWHDLMTSNLRGHRLSRIMLKAVANG